MVLKVTKLQLTLLQFFQIITTNVVLKLVPLLVLTLLAHSINHSNLVLTLVLAQGLLKLYCNDAHRTLQK